MRFVLPTFRRVTTSGRFVPEIDGLRFVAIGSVVLFHILGYLSEHGAVVPVNPVYAAISNGSRGVSMFFVISGFILGMPFASYRLAAGQPVSLKKYFLRRLTRLEPPYMLNLLVCAVLLFLVNHRSYPSHLLAGLLYSNNWIYGSQNPINPVSWSLEIEVQFYCLVPLLTAVFMISKTWLRRGLLLVSIPLAGWAQLAWFQGPRLSLSLLYFIQFFVAGLFLADLYISADWKRIPTGLPWDLCLLGWPVVFLASARGLRIWVPLLLILLYISTFKGRITNRIFCFAPVPLIGGMCYSIYLFHTQVASLVFRATGKLWLGNFHATFLAQCALVGTVVLLGCGLYFLIIERPCMRPDWPQRLARYFGVRGNSS